MGFRSQNGFHSALSQVMRRARTAEEPRRVQWGLDGKEDKTKAYVHCPDPSDHTGGGTVVFEISKVG
jgi:hypothetical protein